jgi:SNF2 family DNA or RNA helicase
MIKWNVTPQHFEFSFINQNGQNQKYEDFEKEANSEDYAPKLLIKELLENGQGEILDFLIKIPHEEICSLSLNDLLLLGLPPFFPFDIRIDSDGTLNQTDFKFNWGFYEHPEGKRLSAKRTGALVELESGAQYLLTLQQFQLCQALDEFNSLPGQEKEFNKNLVNFAEIKGLSAQSVAVLDEYLKNENVFVPSKITVGLKKNADDSIEISPEIAELDQSEEFKQKFDRFPVVRPNYTVSGEGDSRVRIVLTKPQSEELEKFKKHKRLSGKQKEEFLKNPQRIFDENIIELDEFSQRVIEIGLYQPKYYPFISPYKSKWIPGILIDDVPIIRFEKIEELKKFQRDFEKAVANGETKIILKNGKEIDISTEEQKASIHQIISQAEEQLKNPQPATETPKPERNVLIIKENIDFLEYEEGKRTEEPFLYQYQSPPFLKIEFSVLDYQQEGIAWLQFLYTTRYSGGLLADDMGLGKTFQLLSFLMWHYKNLNSEKKPYLIIAPVALLENWQIEYLKFFENTELPVLKYYDAPRLNQKEEVALLRKRQIVLTNYETIRGKRQFSFGLVNWAIVILDEAQKIKTPGTLVTNAAKALKADFKIAATGTPVENTLMDLWCILDFCVPGLLGSAKDFARKFQNPIKNEDTDIIGLGEVLREKIGLHIIRRLKSDVLHNLPAKNIIPLKKQMPEAQITQYKLKISEVKSIEANSKNRTAQILKLLSQLRDISDHPYLNFRQIEKIDYKELIQTSAKLQLAIEIIEKIKNRGEKVIVYAERKQTQRLLVKVFADYFHINLSELHIVNGETPAVAKKEKEVAATRQGIVDKFQQRPGFSIIVMSPLAVGFGLNITSANHVIHYSRHWNPSKEEQATDRVFRIGQTRDVQVYYPMSITPDFESFDIILDRLLEKKKQLSGATLFPTERIEIDPEEFLGEMPDCSFGENDSKRLQIEDIDFLHPHLFEAFIAVLWRKQGFKTVLTPVNNDKGADVIAFSENRNVLFQVKQGSSNISDSAIGEIMKSSGFYSAKYQQTFSLAVISNQKFTQNTKQLAAANDIKLIGREDLITFLKKFSVHELEVSKMDGERLNSV